MEQSAAYTHIINSGHARVILGNVYGSVPTGFASSPEHTTTKILGLLNYPQREDRHEEIADAYTQTFEWIFKENPSDQAKWSSFIDFLRTGEGVYWISGKLGSGKSTLMKFLIDHPRVHEALDVWAGGKEVTVLKFFFWKVGTDLQRNRAGLLRSILYQVLQKHPELGPQIFPKFYVPHAEWSCFPSNSDLKSAFRTLLTLTCSDFRILCFIDGLDEYELPSTDSFELDTFLAGKSRSCYMKLVISSRPLSMFETAFSLSPKLRLHQLTHEDIRKYVWERLEHNMQIDVGDSHDAELLGGLVNKILDRADGVFLWVKLAVRSILEGIYNGDSADELKSRLSELPIELEDMFHHMLQLTPVRYHTDRAKILQVVIQSEKFGHKIPLTPLALSFALDGADEAIKCPVKPLSYREAKDRISKVEKRVQNCCGGLVELIEPNSSSEQIICNEFFTDGPEINVEQRKITLAHRSVAEFLQKPEGLSMYGMNDQFRATSALLYSKLRMLKSHDPRKYKGHSTTTEDCLKVLANAYHAGERVDFPWIDEFEKVTAQQRLLGWRAWSMPCEYFALRHMHDYLRHKLETSVSDENVRLHILLDYACSYPSGGLPQPSADLTRLETIEYLLKSGANPNAYVWDRSVFGNMLYNNLGLSELRGARFSNEILRARIKAIGLLLQYGAFIPDSIVFTFHHDYGGDFIASSPLGALRTFQAAMQQTIAWQDNGNEREGFGSDERATDLLDENLKRLTANGERTSIWRVSGSWRETLWRAGGGGLYSGPPELQSLIEGCLHNQAETENLNENWTMHRLREGTPEFMEMIEKWIEPDEAD